MKAAEVEGKIKCTVDPLQCGRIAEKQLCPNACPPDFLTGKLDGTRGEIHADHIPAGAG
jgi:hypothetical protein